MNLQEMWNSVINFFENSGWSIVIFLAVFVVGIILIRAICFGISKMLLRGKVEKSLIGFIIAICRFVLYLILIFVLAAVLNIDMTPLASAIAAALVAVGLALQNSLSNIASGIVIISTHPFKEGDYVDIGSVSGTVKSIGMFVTELITTDNKKIVITNTNVINEVIINYSERSTRRVDMFFSISYNSNVELAKAIIMRAINGHSLTLKDPEPIVRLHEFKDSSINIVTRMWVKTEDYWSVYWDMNEQIFAEFKKHGIEIPFNQLDVHLKGDN